MLRSSDNKRNEILLICILIVAATGIVLYFAGNKFPNIPYRPQIISCGKYLLFADAVIIVAIILTWLFSHGVHKGGLKYVFLHSSMVCSLKVELQDAGIYVKRYYMNEEVAVVPTVKVLFADNYMTGEVRIRKTIKDHSKLEEKDISCALGNYIVEQSFTTSDGNFLEYSIFNAVYDRQLIFENCEEFKQRCANVGDYDLMIDTITTIPLHHSLICGQTGSGKSYACNSLIYQFLTKNVHYNLYFADPKQNGLAVIGKAVDETRTADTIDGIIELIKLFHTELEKRKEFMKSKLINSKAVDSDFRSFQLEPFVLIVDEYLAFSLSLANYKKEIRDEVSKMLSDVVLMGRSCGFFIFMVAQASPATQLPTFIRDQLVFKVVLGNSDKSTYTTTFDSSADIPTGKFSAGYGVYTYAGKTDKPKILAFPTIRNFDIIDSISRL